MRNDIIGIYMNDGSYDPGDETSLPRIAAIASTLGDALSAGKSWKRYFTPSVPLEIANIKGIGAAQMYQYILNSQDEPGFMQSLWNDIKRISGLSTNDWGLPPLSATPFSDANLSAPPPPPKQCFTETELQRACASMRDRFAPKGTSFTERYQNEPEAAACCQK